MIIPEIKMSEAKNGKSLEYYLERAGKYPIIAINTSSLFKGSIPMLKKAREMYGEKKIIRKDFIMIPRQIDKFIKIDYALLLAEYLPQTQLERLGDYCHVKGILPLIEVSSYKKFKHKEMILVNSRNLNTGEINREKAIELCKEYKKEGYNVIYGSGENSDMIARQKIADYVLIGTAFMKETLQKR